jgi:MtrB/PioB family decaheme-associated outer membrane protein
MKTSRQYLGFSQTMVALAVLAAFSPARAQEAADSTKPTSTISVGVGLLSGSEQDRARFGMFNGLRKHDTNGLLGFTYLNRDNASGTWMSLEGANLGLDNRELGFSYRRLGDMKFTADYSELVRHDPRTINTSLAGAGTTTPTVSLLATPRAGQDLNLELRRKSFSLGLDKWLGGALQVEVNFKNEDKDGARLFGKGFACSQAWKDVGACSGTTAAAVLLLPEPIDSTIRQLDTKLNYSGEKLHLSGGYYGSFYTNRNNTLNPTIVGRLGDQNGGLNPVDAGLANVLGQPMVLPPDNQSHQLSLAGNYTLTSHTLLNFKYAYTHATQNESFPVASTLASGRTNLGAVLDTTKAQVGFSSHLMDKLHVHGDLTYNSKNNKTPIDLYNNTYNCASPGVVSGRSCVVRPAGPALSPYTVASYTNGNQSPRNFDAKLAASYKLPQNFLLTGGLKYEHEDYGTFTPTDVAGGISGLKQKMKETEYSVELRKSMSQTLTGAISFVSSKREGDSSWLRPNDITANQGTGVVAVTDAQIFNRTAIFPFIYMDRKRDKVRLMTNWTPNEKLSLQLFWDNGRDSYSAPTEHGLRRTGMDNVSLDAAYNVSEAWRVHGYLSRGVQSRNAGHSTGYDADLNSTTSFAGMGFSGKPAARLQLGGELTWSKDKLVYTQTLDPSNTTAANTALISNGGLPDVTYNLLRLNLYGSYALQKNAYVRLDLIHNRTSFNEWTYNFNGLPYLFSDNTTINAQEKQSVTFVGASYIYSFQ